MGPLCGLRLGENASLTLNNNNISFGVLNFKRFSCFLWGLEFFSNFDGNYYELREYPYYIKNIITVQLMPATSQMKLLQLIDKRHLYLEALLSGMFSSLAKIPLCLGRWVVSFFPLNSNV